MSPTDAVAILAARADAAAARPLRPRKTRPPPRATRREEHDEPMGREAARLGSVGFDRVTLLQLVAGEAARRGWRQSVGLELRKQLFLAFR